MDKVEDHLKKVTANMNETRHLYESLQPKTEPIPFFGDIENAHILTVGVNPSSTAFDRIRGKPDERDKIVADNLNSRLQNYFALYSHKWLDFWELALEPLGASYQAGSAHLAAHLDLSPRATKSMSSTNRDTFLAMMKEDAKWFFELLPQCKSARVMLIAGSVTNRYRIDEFVECIAYRHGYKLDEPSAPRAEGIGFNRLSGHGVDIPMFFSSVSPSDKQRRLLLVDRIKEHKERLFELLGEQPASART